ncbi:Squalene/phytoene synthase [Usnea florida]
MIRAFPKSPWPQSCIQAISQCLPRSYSTPTYGPPAPVAASEAEVQSAKNYCSGLLQKFDSPSHTLLAFIPPPAQPAYLALRAFNIETSRIADTVSTPTVGSMRLQFWRDNLNRAFANTPAKEPVSILLSHALADLDARTGGAARMSKSWLMRIVGEREKYLNNAPYPTLESLEKYAENTYSTLLYLTLQALPMGSVTADHIASHIGKAVGITAVLRGLPLVAFPPPPNHHSNSSALGGTLDAQRRSQGSVTLPLDVMARTGLRDEDVLRRGAEADGLRDAVFEVATRASDHLITARQMLKNVYAGEDVDHAFEYEDEEGHDYEGQIVKGPGKAGQQKEEVDRAFGVFMPAVATGLWLDKLQKLDFDIFREELRRRDWKLPWKAYFAYRRRMF